MAHTMLILIGFWLIFPARKHKILIVIAALTQSLSTDNLPVNWFDAALLIVIGVGLFRGRKNGMTKEILPTFMWVIIVVGSGFGYPFLAQIYINNCGLGQHKVLAALLAYLTITLVVFLIFSGLKKAIMPRLEGSNIFGSSEYYLGMPAGMIRYFSITMFVLALINARYYSPADIAATKAYNERWYGGGMYSGNYIPDLHSIQEAVFKKSFTGPYLKQYLAVLLVDTGPDSTGGQQQAAQKQQPVIHMGN